MLHSIRQKSYGLNYNNYIGPLSQENGVFLSWSEFYLTRRIYPQLRLYFGSHKNSDQEDWNNFSNWVNKNLIPDFSSLLHGDLWSGNLYYSINGPIFIDPSIYHGHFMVDLAFTELFGGFGKAFYASYNKVNPVGKIYRELRDVYQVYPLLVHANIFGGDYYFSALNRARKYKI